MIDLRHERGMTSFVANSMLQGSDASEADVISNLYSETSEFFGVGTDSFYLTSGQVENMAIALNTVRTSARGRIRVLCSVLDDISASTALPGTQAITDMCTTDANGIIDEKAFKQFLSKKPDLVVLTLANEETGAITDICKYAALAKDVGAFVYVDATYGAAWMNMVGIPIDVDLVGLEASKLGGPEGVGLLHIKSTVSLTPLHLKFNPSQGFNMVGAAGLSAALFTTLNDIDDYVPRVKELRDTLDHRMSSLPGVTVNCWAAPRVANITNYCFSGVDSRVLYLLLRKMGILTMYTCESLEGLTSASFLMHMISKPGDVHSNLRIEISKETTDEEIDFIYDKLSTAYSELLKMHTYAERRERCAKTT